MADNVEITKGQGTSIRTDDIGGGLQVQYVKLMDGTDGSGTPISIGQQLMTASLPVVLASNQSETRVLARPYLSAVAEGDVANHSIWEKTGFTPTMTTAESVVWSKAGAYVFPTSDMQMEVISGSSDDSTDAVGAQEMTIKYLDAAFAEKTEVVQMKGTAATNTVATDIYRINSFRVTKAGSSAKAVGAISLRSVGGAATYSYIAAGYTRARNSVYTVPASKTLYIISAALGYAYAASQTHYGRLWVRANQNEGVRVANIYYPFVECISQNGTIPLTFESPLKIVSGVDIYAGGIGTASGIATSVLRGWIE